MKNQITYFIIFQLLLSVFQVVSSPLLAQNASHIANVQHFSTEDGLSHRAIKSIFQDQDGIIWIGTQNGINRFDGYGFKHYLGKNHGADLRDNVRIGQDDEGWLWLCTMDHKITFFNPKTEEAKTIEERFGADCILLKDRSYLITSINDSEGRLYIQKIPSNELYTYYSSEGFKKITAPFKFKDTALREITDKGALILFNFIEESQGTKGIFSKWEIKDNAFHSLDKTENWSNVGFQWVEKHFKTELTWKINKEGLCQVFDKDGQLLVSLDDFEITNFQGIFFDNINRAWISTGFGFYIVEIQKNKFQFLTAPTFANFGTSARGISVDDKKMTIAFEPQGIGQYDFQTSKWSLLGRITWNRAIYQTDKNAFWIGSADDLSHWQGNQFQHYPYIPTKDVFGRTHGLASWVICPSQQNKHQLWLGGESYLVRFDTKKKAYQHFEHPDFKTKNLIVQSITYDKNNKNWLWLCTYQGLFLFDEQKEKFIAHYNDNQSNENFLPSEGFYHLYQEGNVYWLGTIGNGLVRWEREKGEFQQFTIKDGLANDVIYAVYPDDPDSYRDGNLWMSSDYGIIQMNKKTFSVKNFSLKNGIGQTEFNRTSHFEYQDKNGDQQLFFGGLTGITSFYPKDFQQATTQKIKPHLSLLKFQQFNSQEQTVLDKTISLRQSSTITLKPNDYVFQLEVGLLNYNDVDNNQYSYQININGQQSTWHIQKNRTIQLGQLPYGKHQLIIKAKTISNLAAINDLKYTIIVRRPFYLTWWFMVLALVSIGSGGYYFYKRRTTAFIRKQTELEELVNERTQELQKDKQIIEKQAEELRNLDKVKSNFFANVSHELRTPLTLMMGPMSTIEKSNNLNNRNWTLLQMAQQNGTKLLKLINEILDLGKLESGKLELDEQDIVLYSLVRRIVSFFESLAESKSIRFLFNYELDKKLQIALDANKFEVILNNFLSNAFKYTPPNKTIQLTIKEQQSKILIVLKDEGRGIHPGDLPYVFDRYYQTKRADAAAEGGTGIGLATCYEFAKLFKGKTWVESTFNQGAAFYFEFPYTEVLATLSDEAALEIANDETYLAEEKAIHALPLDLVGATTAEERPTILVVEDNLHLSEYIKMILSNNYHVITAFNGKEALERLTENRSPSTVHRSPSLIISDVMMPIMDGFQLLEELKSKDQYRHIPVVMLTARAAFEDKLKALRIGVDDYMLKPFKEEELLARVENLLTNYEERSAFVQIKKEEPSQSSNAPIITEEDQKWLAKVEKLVLKEMNNTIFSNEYLAELLFISTKSLYRKVKSLTGLTPNKYIRTIRLQQAKILLEKGKSVKVTAHEVGFQKVNYFSTLFKKEFGKLPSEYL